MIKNCHKNIMGTISFDGKFPGMRKEQDFIVYPMQDSGVEITIQSDHRFGKINLNTGESIISANRAQYANSVWLAICIATKKSISFVLSAEDCQTLRQWVKSSGGVEVGSGGVVCDNTGAIAL